MDSTDQKNKHGHDDVETLVRYNPGTIVPVRIIGKIDRLSTGKTNSHGKNDCCDFGRERQPC